LEKKEKVELAQKTQNLEKPPTEKLENKSDKNQELSKVKNNKLPTG